MSLATWKKEFANEKSCEKLLEVPVTPRAVRKALDNSLTKWQGLRKRELNKHGVVWPKEQFEIQDAQDDYDYFGLDSGTCHLCQLFQLRSDGCTGCPLDTVGENCCEGGSAFEQSCVKSDPTKMINALKKASRRFEKK